MCVALSAAGEQCVDEEIKRALLGVKQVKETMEKKEERHRHLMEALRLSRGKKKVSTVFLLQCVVEQLHASLCDLF